MRMATSSPGSTTTKIRGTVKTMKKDTRLGTTTRGLSSTFTETGLSSQHTNKNNEHHTTRTSPRRQRKRTRNVPFFTFLFPLMSSLSPQRQPPPPQPSSLLSQPKPPNRQTPQSMFAMLSLQSLSTLVVLASKATTAAAATTTTISIVIIILLFSASVTILYAGKYDTNVENGDRFPVGPCAINLYGLPRSFQQLVLPSLIQNVIRINAKYQCDYYVHYFNATYDPPGRDGRGGYVDSSEIYLLRKAVLNSTTTEAGWARTSNSNQIHKPIVRFMSDTEETFRTKRGRILERIHTERDAITNRFVFVPTNHPSYTNATIDNVIKMWHGQQAVWDLMVRTSTNEERDLSGRPSRSQQQQPPRRHYSRVAFFRCDVVYVTPVDIYRIPSPSSFLGNRGMSFFSNRLFRLRGQRQYHVSVHLEHNQSLYDVRNQYAVVPAFAQHPVNDRYIAGPYDAVKIWASERFRHLDRHVQMLSDHTQRIGDGVHSERYLAYTIFPAIRDAGIAIALDESICFLRARSDQSIRLDDCGVQSETLNKYHASVEHILGRTCIRNVTLNDSGKSNIVHLEC